MNAPPMRPRMSRIAAAASVLLILAIAGAAAASEAQAEPVLFRDIRVLTVTDGVRDPADVLLRGETIAAVAAGGTLDTAGVRVIPGRGLTLLPGLIDAKTHIGLAEVWQVSASVDIDETTIPSTPHLQVVDALHPGSAVIPVTRAGGVTTVLVAPGEANVFSGQSAVVHLTGGSLARMLIRSPAAVHATLGEKPKATYGPRHKMPMSRMGLAALFRERLAAARDDMQRRRRFREEEARWVQDPQGKAPSPPERNLELEALASVLRGEMPLVVAAHRAGDIELALRLAGEFSFRLILDHATEGWKLADEIARRGVPVLVGPVTVQPSTMQTLGARYDNAAILHAAGAVIAIQTGGTHNARNLPFEAGLAVAHGLPWESALRAVTLNPARIFGLDDRLGSVEEGKEATLVAVEGRDPFQPRDRIRHVFIRGREYPPQSYQTAPLDPIR
ncbi:MAG: amidohydrolase family protein [Candidatus Eisenbacteria bacterium]|nr:amidohydrolase family protein [Candidatus Eisenbacteria bacterium]